ncbi:MAG: WGR domain-containing protein [Pseudomonadota bacterium]
MSDTRGMIESDNAHLDLVRVVPSENMARFYGIALQPTLFGEVAVVRCWGRIGTRGRVMAITYPDAEQAIDAMVKLENTKRRRGYVTTDE